MRGGCISYHPKLASYVATAYPDWLTAKDDQLWNFDYYNNIVMSCIGEIHSILVLGLLGSKAVTLGTSVR